MIHISTVQLTQRCTEENLTHEGELVLHYASTLPQMHGLSPRPQRRINRYYQHLEHIFQTACRTELLTQASQAAQGAHASALPFTAMESTLTYETTYLDDDFWSLAWIWCVTCGSTPLLFREQGDVWSLRTGLPCRLCQFTPPKQKKKQRFLNLARNAAAAQHFRGPGWMGRRSSFTISDTELHCFWPTALNSRCKEDFFSFSAPFSVKGNSIC